MIYTDLLFFLCLLPFSVLFSFFDRSTEYKNLILVITSLLVFSWGKPFGVCLLFFTAVAEWLLALWIEKKKENDQSGVLPLAIDIIMNLAVLFIFSRKLLYVREDALGFAKLLTSLGIMYYVIRGFSYVYDVYKGKIKAEKNVFCMITYMCAYFLMPVGPVVRYGETEPLIRNRSLTVKSITNGLNSFVYGLGKAVIIAPVLRKIGMAGFNFDEINLIGCWAGALSMLGFAYFLFTGFCDMSWGLASIYGFDIKRNYRGLGADGIYEGVIKSCGTTMFDFFEEVVSDFGRKFGFFKNPLIVLISALTAFMFKQNLLFLIAGIIVGVLIVAEKSVSKEKLGKMPVLFKFIFTYAVSFIILGGLFCNGVKDWGKWFGGLFGIGDKYMLSVDVKYAIINNIFVIIAALLMLSPLKNALKKKALEYAEKSVDNYGKLSIIRTIFTAMLFIACIIIITSANVNI